MFGIGIPVPAEAPVEDHRTPEWHCQPGRPLEYLGFLLENGQCGH
jgi:hypothetical protein